MTANVINIEVRTTDKAGLAKLGQQARKIGQEIERDLGRGFEQTERTSTRAADKMSTAFRGSVRQMTGELDKLERAAALSGDGMSEGYASALAKVRGDLATVAAEASKTGRNFDDGLSGALRSIRRAVDELKPTTDQLERGFDQASRAIERDLQKIERQAWQTGDKLDTAFSTALRSARDEVARLRTEAGRTGDSLESDLGGALRAVREQADQLGESVSSGGKSGGLGGMLDDMIGNLAGAGKAGAAAAGLAVGAAVGQFIWEGVQAEWAEGRVGGLIAAQTGAAADSARGLGDIAGNVFGDAFGESIEDVGTAMTALFQSNLISTRAPEEAIERLTKKVLTLQETTGEGAEKISLSARQLLVNGLAANVSEAMDMIQNATEAGLNQSGELLDTIIEYSTQFRSLGLDGQEAFGLLEQATRGGARNIDIAADALKEFQIRAQDMSDITRRGFESIGLDADGMGRRIAAGGDSARGALAETLNRLNQMPDSVERNSAAVDLFGTTAEDLGNALYDMDLDSAANEFGNFGGSVEEAAQKIAAGQSGLDKFNKFVENSKSGIGELFDLDLPWVDEIQQDIDEINLAKEKFLSTGDTTWLDELKEKYPEAAEGIDQYIAENEHLIGSTEELNNATEEYIGTLDNLISKQREQQTGIIDLAQAQIDAHEALAAANEAADKYANEGLTKTKDGFDLSTEAGASMATTLHDVAETTYDTIEAMRQQAAGSEEVRGYLESQRTAMFNLATEMGLTDEAALALVNRLLGMPDEVVPVVGIRDMATGEINRINRILNDLESRPDISTNYYLYTHAIGNANPRHLSPTYQGRGGMATGGVLGADRAWGAASGGQRHSSTWINESGPELVELPTGSRVATAGAARAMAESGALGGGGPTHLVFSWEGSGDPVVDALMQGIRVRVKNDHGGSVTAAFNQRGVA